MIKITLVKSPITSLPNHVATIKALGLHKVHSSVIKEETPQILGMVNTVKHLVKVEEYKEAK